MKPIQSCGDFMVLYDLIDDVIFLKMLIKGGELVMYYINHECLNMRDFDELSNYWGSDG